MTGALITVSAARKAIDRATTLGEIKDVRDKLNALSTYTKAAGRNRGDQLDVAEAKVCAEWKAGGLLRDAKRAQGRRTDLTSHHNGEKFMALIKAEGIAWQTAHRWQVMNHYPEPKLEAYFAKCRADSKRAITSKDVYKLGKAHLPPEKFEPSDDWTLESADIADGLPTIADESVDVIITDPPYPREFLDCYEHLSRVAGRVLRDGGLCLAMAGQSYLPEVMAKMATSLTYHWTLAYMTPGGQAPQMWARNINSFWKPVLVFSKGGYDGKWVGDVFKSDVNDNDKRFHDWGQSESGMARLVQAFSQKEDTVLDPFVGGGTTAAVAVGYGRKFIGADIDEEAIDLTRRRLAQMKGEGDVRAAS